MKSKIIFLCLFFALILAFPSASISQTQESGKVYKVAILPFSVHSQENLDPLREGIFDIITSRITSQGKIIVIDKSVVNQALAEEKPMRLDDEAARKIGTKVGADYVLLGSLTKFGEYISVDARLISLTEEKPPLGIYTQQKGIDDAMLKIGEFAQDLGHKILGTPAEAPQAVKPKPSFILKEKEEPVKGEVQDRGYLRSQTFGFEIKGVDIGDLDGDGKNEVVSMDINHLYVFKYDGGKLALTQKIEAGSEYNFLTLDVADVNKNGFAEIIVSSVVEDDPRSFIFEYEDGELRKISEKAGWFFRVIEHPQDGLLLLGQERGSEGVPVDPIYQMIWKKKNFTKGPRMPFPSGTTIFALAVANLRKTGKPEIVTLDSSNSLMILSEDGRIQWRSRERFGGTNSFYETRKKSDPTYRPGSAPAWRVYIPQRILVKDLNRDGLPQIIINKNDFVTGTFFENIRLYENGEIDSLSWDEDRLSTFWKTREIDGYIADYQVKDVDQDGREELVVAVIQPFTEEGVNGLLSKKMRSNIIFVKLF